MCQKKGENPHPWLFFCEQCTLYRSDKFKGKSFHIHKRIETFASCSILIIILRTWHWRVGVCDFYLHFSQSLCKELHKKI
jgi:hypothetical protein